mgnify:CR=1 FL=1
MVAGISVGLMTDKDSDKYVLLTDIVGVEDFSGDMDFKVAGTRDGITAIQLDIKVGGVPVQALKEAMVGAKKAFQSPLNVLTIVKKSAILIRKIFCNT